MNQRRLRIIIRFLLGATGIVILAGTFLTQYLYRVLEGKTICLIQNLLFVLQTLTATWYGELLPFASWGMNLFAAVLMLISLGWFSSCWPLRQMPG